VQRGGEHKSVGRVILITVTGNNRTPRLRYSTLISIGQSVKTEIAAPTDLLSEAKDVLKRTCRFKPPLTADA
jgi:hypothetical protein